MLIEQLDALKNELDALRPLDKETEAKVMQKLRMEWNYHSSHIEGNSLTFGETKALLMHGITAKGKPLKDHVEMTGHNEAVNEILEVIKEQRPLSENFIRGLHKVLLKENYYTPAQTADGLPTKKLVQVGTYKQSPNHVLTKTGEMFYFAAPAETPALMAELVEWYKKEKEGGKLHPIQLASLLHYRFVRIHPFDDGNGRMARLLMNLHLIGAGYPPVVIKTQDKENYYTALRQADAENFNDFIDYIAQNLQASLQLMLKAAKGESIIEADDLSKEFALLELEIREKVENNTSNIRSEKAVKQFLNNDFKKILRSLFDQQKSIKKFYNTSSFTLHDSLKHRIIERDLENKVDEIDFYELQKEHSLKIMATLVLPEFDSLLNPNFFLVFDLIFSQKSGLVFNFNENENEKLIFTYNYEFTPSDIAMITKEFYKPLLNHIKESLNEIGGKDMSP